MLKGYAESPLNEGEVNTLGPVMDHQDLGEG